MLSSPIVVSSSVPSNPSPASPQTSSRTSRLRDIGYLGSPTTTNQLPLNSSQISAITPSLNLSLRSTKPSNSSRGFGRSISGHKENEAEILFYRPTGSNGDVVPCKLDKSQGEGSSLLPAAGDNSGIASTLTPSARLKLSRPGGAAGILREGMGRSKSRVISNNVSPAGGLLPPPALGSGILAFGGSGRPGRLPSASEIMAEPDPQGVHTAEPLSSPKISQLPSIQLIAHRDPRQTRPSLSFSSISRTLPSTSSVISVGRYSEKDSVPDIRPNVPSDAPVGFKSKVVSRRHCEFSYSNGQWYVKDVKSSSGTFLNHIRLSQPGVESKCFPVKDGDIIQLGIDFKGGEEMIFRCVKIRVECNRGWQKSLNNYNKSAHKFLQGLRRSKVKLDGETDSRSSTECTICLNAIAPCQALFVAPCSHTWHYKCILTQLGSTQFSCPNCRAVADLDADVDEPEEFEEWEEADPTEGIVLNEGSVDLPAGRDVQPPEHGLDLALRMNGVSIQDDCDLEASLQRCTDSTSRWTRGLNPSASSFIPGPSASLNTPFSRRFSRDLPEAAYAACQHSPSNILNMSGSEDAYQEGRSSCVGLNAPPELNVSPDDQHRRNLSPKYTHRHVAGKSDGDNLETEPPMTPRNDVGPFIFDGTAGSGANGGESGSYESLDSMAAPA